MNIIQHSEEQKNELNRRSIYFFYDPSKSRDEYIKEFNRDYNTDRYAYSPLYLLRRDIYLSLRFDHFCNQLKVDHIAYFPALLLADIIIEGLVFNITAKKAGEKTDRADFKDFYQHYFSFNECEGLITRQLRNALQHNFNQLIIRIDNKGKQKDNFDLIKKYFEKVRNCKIDRSVNYFKLGYQLSTGFHSAAEFGNYKIRKNYYLIDVRVNPTLFLDRLEMAIHQLKENIFTNNELASNFLKNLKIDNWMKVY